MNNQMTPEIEKKISCMQEGGRMLGEIRNQLAQMVAPGVTLMQIEEKANELLLKTGGEPAFKKVDNYHWATCINVNEGVVHGIPTNYVIKDGDVVSIDVGLWYKGYFTDTSTSCVAGEPNPDLEKFLQVGKQTLQMAIERARMGNRVGHISEIIENQLEKVGYHPIEELTGHGVGVKLHEKPHIPGVLDAQLQHSPLLHLGQTLAIEVIYTMGKPEIVVDADGWTIVTKDGKIAGLFEETVAITETGPLVLTA